MFESSLSTRALKESETDTECGDGKKWRLKWLVSRNAAEQFGDVAADRVLLLLVNLVDQLGRVSVHKGGLLVGGATDGNQSELFVETGLHSRFEHFGVLFCVVLHSVQDALQVHRRHYAFIRICVNKKHIVTTAASIRHHTQLIGSKPFTFCISKGLEYMNLNKAINETNVFQLTRFMQPMTHDLTEFGQLIEKL